jgi:hypothetical protein
MPPSVRTQVTALAWQAGIYDQQAAYADAQEMPAMARLCRQAAQARYDEAFEVITGAYGA